MKTDEQQTALRELRQAEHEIRTVALIEWGWPESSPRQAAMRRWAGAIREALALLDASAQGAPLAESIRDEAQAILAHEPVAFAECTVAEDVMARARRILELLS